MFLHSPMCIWCLTLAINEMTAVNEITAKTDHVLFTCNWFMGLRKKSSHVHPLAANLFRKFQQILATAMEPISRKGSVLELVKTFQVSSTRKINEISHSFSIRGSGEVLPLINDLIICKCISYKCVSKGAVVQHSYIMWQSGV